MVLDMFKPSDENATSSRNSDMTGTVNKLGEKKVRTLFSQAPRRREPLWPLSNAPWSAKV